ncbi:hypothetical protein JMJ77_0004432 [Colletotrichum scovillei]|uniref:Uncharacterized protein n=1 Tax=Colletotrichum scovillei TaxID=1209932 RepID=A0A9P7QX00_9PEZI|nr:hypothetical protein JMJ77_0004432 [Colletotrichum scovillei]KAG7049690.1 hypothetical protein JMJ78_0013669 [Colletotrichum scovillei]KAG7064428.1 hypothetical protein JMJ76_0007472 [Colletotrichum scovillei]
MRAGLHIQGLKKASYCAFSLLRIGAKQVRDSRSKRRQDGSGLVRTRAWRAPLNLAVWRMKTWQKRATTTGACEGK